MSFQLEWLSTDDAGRSEDWPLHGAWTMDTQFQNALLIHNPNAGSGGNARRRLIDEARHFLSQNGIQAELAETTGPGHATEIAQEATPDGGELVLSSASDWPHHSVVKRPSSPHIL